MRLTNQVRILTILMSVLVMSCGGPKVLTYKTNAEQAEASGNFEAATESWEQYFKYQQSKNAEITPQVFAQAAKTAYKAGKNDLALSWFEKAENGNYSDPEMYLDLAAIYKQKDNLSKELDALEFYRDKYPDPVDSTGINTRLFDIYAQINNKDKAVEVWPLMNPDNRKKEKYLNEYFTIQSQLDHSEEAEAAAKELLTLDPKNVKALEYLGAEYYHKAEDRYQREMKKYEQNKTHMQHFRLTQQLELVTADFKTSLSYFKKLWEMDKNSRYATYMVNIYTRFNDPEKANYYRKFLK